MDMGGGLYYQTFGLGGQDFGGAYTIPADRPMPPAWCPYANCDSADDVAGKLVAAGGRLPTARSVSPAAGASCSSLIRSTQCSRCIRCRAPAGPGRPQPKAAACSETEGARRRSRQARRSLRSVLPGSRREDSEQGGKRPAKKRAAKPASAGRPARASQLQGQASSQGKSARKAKPSARSGREGCGSGQTQGRRGKNS